MNPEDKEERYNKKLRRVGMNSAWAVGIGVGAFMVRLIAPLIMEPSEDNNALLMGLGTALVVYGIAQLACMVFLRKKAVMISSVLTYIVMPAVLIKLWMDTMM